MKFLYEYRTSDNVRQSGVIRASTRDAAYAQLREKGIKPTRVTDAPGFLNKLFGRGKRWMAIGVLSAVCGVLSFVFLVPDLALPENSALRALHSALISHSALRTPHSALPRAQIYGDPEILRQLAESGWREVFPQGGDQLLAAFAQPGVEVDSFYRMPQRGAAEFVELCGRQLESVAASEVAVADEDGDEVRTMKRIVAGMKEELREYLADGGTAEKYYRRLLARQEEEARLRQRVITEVNSEIERGGDAKALLRERNSELRTMGIMPVVR